MRLDSWWATVLAASPLYTVATANVVLPRDAEVLAEVGLAVLDSSWKRATPQAPDGYAPKPVDCPSTRPSIRSAGSLSNQETTWLRTRRNNTVAPMRELLGRLNITGFDAAAYINTHAKNASALPNIGIAASGGGYRALMNGAGALAAFDSRTPNSTGAGQIGGLLQSATYIAGLSGGSWLVGSLYVNNFTSVQAILDTTPEKSGSLWQFGKSILEGPEKKGIQLLNTAQYFGSLHDSVKAKTDAGFNTSLTDYWGRALSYQLVNATSGGPGYTFSSIADDPAITSGNAPLPIFVADGRAPGELLIPANTTVYEFNPWEMGTFDPTIYGFAPMRYIGSNFSGGSLSSKEACIGGFDNAGFVMGTSSSLFNQFILNLNGTDVPAVLKTILTNILTTIGKDNNDIADWQPNPFFGYKNDTNPNAAAKSLTLVDGGEDLQNLPLHPLIQPIREVDVIFAVDASADTIAPASPNWPNGTALVATYARSLNAVMENGTAFPAIPDQNTFVNLGLNTRPTFFGCNATNQTGTSPLIVYVPNSPYAYWSNVSTYTMAYNNTERNAIIQNGYDVATMGNGTVDKQWPMCVGCAIISRSLYKTGTEVPDVCNQCFDRYCWDGTVNSTEPTPYNPTPLLQVINVKSAAGHLSPGLWCAAAALGASLLAM